MDSVFTLLRVAVSLAVVVGLIWFIGRKVAARNGGLSRGRIRPVVRHGLGQRQSVQVLDVDTTRYVLGIAEHSISVLDSYPVPAAELPVEPPAAPMGIDRQIEGPVDFRTNLAQAQARQSSAAVGQSPIAGSILSAQTWRQFFAVLRGEAKR